MSNVDPQEVQKIHDNMKLFASLVGKIKDDDVRQPLIDLLDEVGDRLAVCPASTSLKNVGAFPGGLVWHSIEVLKVMKELNKVYDFGISSDSMILTALFHDLGKIGDADNDYYLPQDSDWHRDKLGQMYTINEELASTSVSVRSLWWLSSCGPLSADEIGAISALQNMSNMYSSELYQAAPLTLLLQQSVRGVCNKNKGISSVPNK